MFIDIAVVNRVDLEPIEQENLMKLNTYIWAP